MRWDDTIRVPGDLSPGAIWAKVVERLAQNDIVNVTPDDVAIFVDNGTTNSVGDVVSRTVAFHVEVTL